MGQPFGTSHPEPRYSVLSVRRIADHHRLGRWILPSVWFHAHTGFERSDTQNRADGSRTRRSSEREPAVLLRGKCNVIGGWLPSLTFFVRRNMILVYRPLSIAPPFWIIAGGILLISFLSGHLLAPAYLAHLRANPQDPTLLSPSQIVGHGYTPPIGETPCLKNGELLFCTLSRFCAPIL